MRSPFIQTHWPVVLAVLVLSWPQWSHAQAEVISTVRLSASTEDVASAPEMSGLAFGEAVAIDGDIAAIGMPAHNEVGRVGIYTRDGGQWQRTATLVPSDPTDRSFGSSLALERDTLFVLAPGAVYVFDKRGSAWKQTARLTSQVPMRSLIAPLQYRNGILAVRAFGRTADGGGLPGEVFLYQREHKRHGWRLIARVRANDGTEFDEFGASIALEQRTLVVGAPDDRQDEPGAAYVFVRQGKRWIQRQKLAGSDAGPYAGFGSAVALRGGVIIVGAPRADVPGDRGDREGNAYVFLAHRGRWFESQRLNGDDDDHTFMALFGSTIAMGRGLVAFSAPIEQSTFRAEGNLVAFDWLGRHLTSGRVVHHDAQGTGVSMDFSRRRLIAGVRGFGEPIQPVRVGHVVILEFARDPGAEQLAPEPRESLEPEDAQNAADEASEE